MTTRIPAELIFHIIGFLQDNKAALSVCSLCSSALATVSRPLLFHTLRTRLDFDEADRFECLLETGRGVLPLIKRIDVAILILGPAVDQRTTAAISRIMVYRRIQDTPPALKIAIRPPRLSHRLHRPGRLLSHLDSVVQWVTSLELYQLDFTGDSSFWHFVLGFPRLKSLTLGRVNGGERVYIPSDRKSEISHISLKETALDGTWDISWLFDHPSPLPSLTSLDVQFPAVLDRVPIQLGEGYGPMVRTLRFGISIACHPTINQDKLASIAGFMSQFSNLETLTFQGIFVPGVSVQRLPVTFEWIPVALNGVSTTVRRLKMEVVAGHLSYLDIIPWSAIDERLAHHIQSLTIVEILLAKPVGMSHLLENVHREMEKRLPLAAQRGVLRCSAVAEHPI